LLASTLFIESKELVKNILDIVRKFFQIGYKTVYPVYIFLQVLLTGEGTTSKTI
jgi:hypothetical protein